MAAPETLVKPRASRKSKNGEKPETVHDGVAAAEVETVLDEFVEHQKKAITEAVKALESLIPSGFREHGEAALKEVIEGYRRLFNTAIDEIVTAIERFKMDDKAEADEKDEKTI